MLLVVNSENKQQNGGGRIKKSDM